MNEDDFIDWRENNYYDLLEQFIARKYPKLMEEFDDWCIIGYSSMEYEHYEEMKERERISNEQKIQYG